VFGTQSAHAQSFNNNAAQGLQISPASVELNGERGKSYVLKIKLLNVTNSNLTYYTKMYDFGAQGETGSPKVLIDDPLPAEISVTPWLSTLQVLSLKGQETRQLDLNVTIPADAEPGGHYGVVSFSNRSPALQDTGVGSQASPGLLLLIRVAGTVDEKLSIASFTSEQNDKQSGFFEQSPINLVSRFKNEGNVHVKPVGSIEVHDMFGGLTESLPVNSDEGNVLPNSIRRFENELKKDWMFGRYTADLTVGYGTTGQALTNTISFWVIPYKIVGAGLLILVTLIYVLRRLIKVYNYYIIKKSKQKYVTKKTKKPKKK
jgi:hypothetical protein